MRSAGREFCFKIGACSLRPFLSERDIFVYQKEVLPNGLRIVTNRVPDRESVAIGIWIAVGGRYEDEVIKGAAHFLEHVVFKGSKKYSCKGIKESIEGVGGLLNAFTSEEQTCFYAKIPSQHLEQTFDVLSDMTFYPKITKEDVEKEKGVILEEIKMYYDLPQYYVLELLDELLWPNHPLGKNLAGTHESVTGITHKKLRQFHKTYYVPNNIVVAVCGDMEHQKIVNLVKKKLGMINQKGSSVYLEAPVQSPQKDMSLFTKDIEQMHLALGMHGYHENHKDKYALSLLSVILGGNMSSRLFAEIREKKGIAYSIGCSAKCLHDTGVFMIRAGVDNRKIEDAIRCIIMELDKVKQKKISDGEFKRGKDYLLGQLLLGLEDTMDHMLWIGEAVTARDKLRNLKAVVREFEKITPLDLKRIANDVFQQSGYKLSIVGPSLENNKKQIQSIIEAV